MATKVKNVELEQDIIDALAMQAIQKGFGNFKAYAENLLTEQGKKDYYLPTKKISK